MSFADLTIVRCSPEQLKATFTHHWPHWGVPRGFTKLDDYFDREYGLQNEDQPWHKDGKFVSFALVPRSDPTTTDLLASCETYRRRALVLTPGETEPKEVVTYGIASVFCQPQHRGKAYPRHLLSLLHYVLAPKDTLPPFPAEWGAPPSIPGFGDAAFSVLYSDVGKTYYARATKGASEPGWVNLDVGKDVYPVNADTPAASTEGWKWLDLAQAHAMEAEATRRIRRDLPATGDKTKTRVAVIPEGGWFKINPQRYFLCPPGAPRRADPKFGAILPSDKEEKPFFVWTVNQQDDGQWRLIVSHISGDVPFEAVVAAAKSQECTAIEAWLPYGWNKEGAKFEDDHSIPCLAQYGLGDTEWEFCEKYAWI